MVIVSQNKKEIYNFNNACSVQVMGKKIYIEMPIQDYTNIIGEYGTEERAKEILNGIVDCYFNTIISMGNSMMEARGTNASIHMYEMPQA